MSQNQRMPVLVNLQTNERITLKGNDTVGRSPENQIALPDDEYASGEHAKLFWDNGWFIEDAGSSNRTYVNDQLISGRHQLQPNDLIMIGRTTFRIE